MTRESSRHFQQLPTTPEVHNLLAGILDVNVDFLPRLVDKPIAIYGAGNLGRMAREYFDDLKIQVSLVIDRNAVALGSDPYWDGIEVMPPSEVSDNIKQTHLIAICIVTVPYIELAESLRNQGWNDVVPFYDVVESYLDRHPLGNGWFVQNLEESEISNLSNVIDRWYDDISRAHHLQFLAWRMLREEWIFDDAPVDTNNRFFIPEVIDVLTDNESFADFGAHNGSSSERFIEEVRGAFKQIWAVEPDADNYALLRTTVANLPPETAEKFETVPVAVGSERKEEMFFGGIGFASRRSELGDTKVTVQPIDYLDMSPTFIKMHLEGSELDALQGALNVIKKFRPIIAATSYHNQLGIWEIPKWVMDELPNYRFHMRMHGWCGTAAVVYCVPEERHETASVSGNNR
jgi:FkbM family methyltransferase